MAIEVYVHGVPANNGGQPTPNQPTPNQPSPQPTPNQSQPTTQPQYTPPQSPAAPNQPQSQPSYTPPSTPNAPNQPQVSPPTPTAPASPQPAPQNPNQSTTQPQSGSNVYVTPDFTPYAPVQGAQTNTSLPTPDRLVNDIRAEISRRGILMVPGTTNFNTMMNAFRQNMYNSSVGQVENQYAARVADIDSRKEALMHEVKTRLENWRQNELAGATSQADVDDINKRYQSFLNRDKARVERFFVGEYVQAENARGSQLAEAQQNLVEALQRLTDELNQGNKDSYLNKLRDRYKEEVWKRDNAETEDEARQASREAAKVQERINRIMGGGGGFSIKSALMPLTSIPTQFLSGYINWDRNQIQQQYVGFDMASSILNGNAFNVIRQENALKEQENQLKYSTAGTITGTAVGALSAAAYGAQTGSSIGPWGSIIGGLIGAGIGMYGAHRANRPLIVEDEQTKVADLWRNEEQRMMQFNDLAMLMQRRAGTSDIESIRNSFILASGMREFQKPEVEQDKGIVDTVSNAVSGAFDWLKEKGKSAIDYLTGSGDKKEENANQTSTANQTPQTSINSSSVDTENIWRNTSGFDIYDLGYTAAEFSQQATRRIKQRGFVGNDALTNALYADALEKVLSMNSGALASLSQYDRFGRNNANQDFADLVATLDQMGTTGMRNGEWVRSDEFAGYMSQLQNSQRSMFLTVDNKRAARQVATGQRMFGDRFGAEALQGIQQVNQSIQNQSGGFAQTLLYDVIQELYPDTRGRIDLIEQAQYDPNKQLSIQQEYYKRIQRIYGGADTTSGYLAMQSITGIKNPNVLMPIARQLTKAGGLEGEPMYEANQEAMISPLKNNYTPDTTKRLNSMADQQMKSLLYYQENITEITQKILDKIETSIGKKLQEAVEALKD